MSQPTDREDPVTDLSATLPEGSPAPRPSAPGSFGTGPRLMAGQSGGFPAVPPRPNAGSSGGFPAVAPRPGAGASGGFAAIPGAGSTGEHAARPAGASGGYPVAAPMARASQPGAFDSEASVEVPPPPSVAPPPPLSERPPDYKDPYIGTTFDHRYKIEAVIGEGGMGVVYRARHKVIDKRVAVKVLRADLAREAEILNRFVQEARAASSIGNPHIVDISDFGTLPDASTYFVMEYLEGRALTSVLEQDKRLSVERICHIGQQTADGLAAAHEAGIFHRDLKPDNVFLIARGTDKDFVKILDFGIAKVSNSGSEARLTQAGAIFGTPHYMSPEQAAGAPVDHRTDIYSLGVMLYEMASGQLPFNADNLMGILTQHMYKAPVPIRALVPAPDCPPGLEAVILKCLSKRPEHRYQTMNELAADLAVLGRGDVPQAVHEMMARSGGFNVPHDFFAQAKAIVPATPVTPRKHLPRYVWVAGALSAVALVTLIVVKGSATDASTPVPESSAVVVAPPPTAPTASAAVPAVKKKTVALAVSPDTAVALRDGEALKLPAIIEVEEGKVVTLEVRADGYDSQTVSLDGSEPNKTVKLVATKGGHAPAAVPRPPTGATGKPPAGAATGKGHSEVIDPWAH